MKEVLVWIEDCDKSIAFIQGLTPSSSREKENTDQALKLIRLEKTIYTALTKDNNAIFPLLLSKFDDTARVSHEQAAEWLGNGLGVDRYLNYCDEAGSKRKFIKEICDYGMAR